ncbi:hypothetical protein [Niabella ginsengisoli]|uniref:Prokaryotic glutathione synthetase N-terminal domain-containing protein n=1 Tax=Niabella ginsengisoli TaxID=522298 RepID=A0ABS9SLV7_9BACT|nr:hypothetical protein [Niabella ginsengisoli]MCH5599355.1 hypothetical protein [Niabella ginsengisoli]
MKIAFVINDYDTEEPLYTTTRLALQALQMGHDVFYIAVEDFSYTASGQMGAHKKSSIKKIQKPQDIHG